MPKLQEVYVGNICFIRAPQKEHVGRTYDAPMWDERKLSGHHQDDNLMIKRPGTKFGKWQGGVSWCVCFWCCGYGVCLMQVNWLRSSVVRAYFAEVVNSSVDGVCLDALHVFLAMAGMTEESWGQHWWGGKGHKGFKRALLKLSIWFLRCFLLWANFFSFAAG